MKITIPEDILEKTTWCENDFSCVSINECDKLDLCKVLFMDHEDMLHVKIKEESDCPYQWLFGLSHICHCPIRKELYINYNA
jgi:hypothetical protein